MHYSGVDAIRTIKNSNNYYCGGGSRKRCDVVKYSWNT